MWCFWNSAASNLPRREIKIILNGGRILPESAEDWPWLRYSKTGGGQGGHDDYTPAPYWR